MLPHGPTKIRSFSLQIAHALAKIQFFSLQVPHAPTNIQVNLDDIPITSNGTFEEHATIMEMIETEVYQC
jgi:hypothetical protein